MRNGRRFISLLSACACLLTLAGCTGGGVGGDVQESGNDVKTIRSSSQQALYLDGRYMDGKGNLFAYITEEREVYLTNGTSEYVLKPETPANQIVVLSEWTFVVVDENGTATVYYLEYSKDGQTIETLALYTEDTLAEMEETSDSWYAITFSEKCSTLLGMTGIVEINQTADEYATVILKKDEDGTGMVQYAGYHEETGSVDNVQDIGEIMLFWDYPVILQNDGTVVAAFPETNLDLKPHRDKMEQWHDVVDLEWCGDGILGLTKDGSVVTTSYTLTGVQEWTDICQLSARNGIAAGVTVTAGSAGKVVVLCETENKLLSDTVEAWENIHSVKVLDGYIAAADHQGTVHIAYTTESPKVCFSLENAPKVLREPTD